MSVQITDVRNYRLCYVCPGKSDEHARKCEHCGAPFPRAEALAYAARKWPLWSRLRPYTMLDTYHYPDEHAREWAKSMKPDPARLRWYTLR